MDDGYDTEYAHRIFILNNFMTLFEGQPKATVNTMKELFPEQMRRMLSLMTEPDKKKAALLR